MARNLNSYGKQIQKQIQYAAIPKQAIITRAVFLNRPSMITKHKDFDASRLSESHCGIASALPNSEACLSLECVDCPFQTHRGATIKSMRQWLKLPVL